MIATSLPPPYLIKMCTKYGYAYYQDIEEMNNNEIEYNEQRYRIHCFPNQVLLIMNVEFEG